MARVRETAPLQPEGQENCVADDHPSRPSRIQVDAPVMINVDAEIVEATACDVSERGLKIELGETLPPGPVSIKLPGFPMFTGEVRWRDADRVGLRFLHPIPAEFLATWVDVHGLRPRRRARGAS